MPETWNPNGPNGTIIATRRTASDAPRRYTYRVTMPSGRELPGAFDSVSLLEYARYFGFRVTIHNAA